MHRRDTEVVLAALLLVCAALLYLDWRRQGEIENLHARIDTLERRLPSKAAQPTTGNNEPVRQSTVERILHASDDRTLADIAREGA